MYDNAIAKDEKTKWLEKKEAFREFLVTNLKVKDEEILERLMEEFDEGLYSNVDLRFLLYGLGCQEVLIDYIVTTYNAGEKPKEKTNEEPLVSSAVVDTVKEELNKPRYNYEVKEYDKNAVDGFRSSIEKDMDSISSKPLINIEEHETTENSFEQATSIPHIAGVYHKAPDLSKRFQEEFYKQPDMIRRGGAR